MFKQVTDYGKNGLLYEVNELGQVRRIGGQRVLKGSPDSSGHVQVQLCDRGTRVTAPVHRLVALAFLPPPEPGQEVCHNTSDKTDCRVVNLRWDTHHENIRDTVRQGRHAGANKTHCPQGHEYTYANTRLYRGKRSCRKCNGMRQLVAPEGVA
jgi:hypothetical protein